MAKTYNVTSSNDMSLDQICTLFNGYNETRDSIGNPVRQAAQGTEVFCAEVSLMSSEYFKAGTNGIQAETELLIDGESYENQSHCAYDGEEYRIYRRYRRTNGLLELYLTKE